MRENAMLKEGHWAIYICGKGGVFEQRWGTFSPGVWSDHVKLHAINSSN